jgi:hypothetical protein
MDATHPQRGQVVVGNENDNAMASRFLGFTGGQETPQLIKRLLAASRRQIQILCKCKRWPLDIPLCRVSIACTIPYLLACLSYSTKKPFSHWWDQKLPIDS